MVDLGGTAGERLRQFIERVERLEEERRALGADIREVYSEAKALGFEPKIMRSMNWRRPISPKRQSNTITRAAFTKVESL